MSQPTEELVRARAHELWTKRGIRKVAPMSSGIRPNKNRGTRTSHRLCGRRTQIARRAPSISPVLREEPHHTNCHLSRHCGTETNSKRLREGPRLSPKLTVQIQSRSANHCNDKGRVDSSFRRRSPHSKRDRHLWLSARAHVLNSGSSLYLWLSATGAVLNGG
jgi:hypothetical protein